MKKFLCKIIYKTTIITLVLGFFIQTISLFPFYVFASTTSNFEEININSVNNVDEDNVRLLYEVEDLRSDYLKVFRRTDGKLEYAYYDDLVNYYDGEKYVEVDASYKLDNNEYSQVINKYSVKLPKKIYENKKIKLSFDNSRSLEITYNDISKTEGVVIDSENNTDKINELKNISGSVLYSNIFDNVDLKIESSGTKFKENIILNEYVDNFSFSYNIKLKGLTLKKENNNISFIDENGSIIYEISPYFMYDESNNYSEDIELKVEETKSDEYKFTVTPSVDYLKSATYPVIIDPVLSYTASTSSDSVIRLKTIQKGFSSTQSTTQLRLIKYINEVEGITENIGCYGIMEVNLPSTLEIYDIDYAYVRLKGYSANYEDKAVIRRIKTSNYDFINGTTSYVMDNSLVEMENAGNSYYTIDLTNYYNVLLNNKVTFEISPENFYGNETTQLFGTQLSSGSYLPVVNIVACNYDGLSSDRTYESVSAGNAGTIYIDNALGLSNLGITGYNNDNLNLIHHYSQSVSGNIGFGNKMNISLYERITEVNDEILCYTNGTGYNEYFYYDENTNTYKSEDGNNSYIELNGYRYTYISESIKKEFGFNDIITKIMLNHDSEDEKLRKEINYELTGNLITSVSCDDARINLVYKTVNNQTLLDYVKVQKDIKDGFEDFVKIVYTYDNSYNLINVKKYQGNITEMETSITTTLNDTTLSEYDKSLAIAEISLDYLKYQNYYEYDSNNNLIKAYSTKNYISYEDNPNAYSGIALSYEGGKVSKYSYKLESTSDLKQAMTFTYGDKQTTLTDYTGYSRTYLFDYFDHTINVLDSKGYAVNYSYANFAGELSSLNPKYYLKNQITHISDAVNTTNNPVLNGGFENASGSSDVCYWKKSDNLSITSSNLTQESPFGNLALKLGKEINNSTLSAKQTIYMPIGNYTLTSVVKTSSNILSNDNFVGYIKVVSNDEGAVMHEEKTFSNKMYEYVETTFTVNYPTYVEIICGIRPTNENENLSIGDYAYFDNIGVSNGSITSTYNLIENSSFEINPFLTGDNNVDTRWNLNYASITERYTIDENFGISNLRFSIKGTATQTIDYNTKPGDLFTLYAFSNYENSTGNLKVKVRFYDSTNSNSTGYYTLRFVSGVKYEQFALGSIKVDNPTGTEEVTYNKIQIIISNESPNVVTVDNVTLLPVTNGKAYEYNELGKVTKITEGTNETTIGYDEDGYTINQIKTSNVGDELNEPYTSVNFNESYINGRTLKEYVLESFEETTTNTTSFKTMDFEKENDESGSIYTSFIDDDNYGYTTSAIYDEYYKYQLSYTDEFGNTTNYEYDYYTGNIIKSSTNYDHYLVDEETLLNYVYTYDKYGNLQQFKMSNSILNPNFDETLEEGYGNAKEIEFESRAISYEYDSKGNITTLLLNNTNERVYHFDYDEFNMLTSVRLNDLVIKQYEYLYINGINTGLVIKEINGELIENSYNYTYYEYSYDNNYNIESYTYNYFENNILKSIPQAIYKYDENSTLTYYQDCLENLTYYYIYDINGNLKEIRIFDETITSDNTTYDYVSFEYDTNNRITKVNRCFNGNTQTTEYTYKNSELKSLTINDTLFTKPEEVIKNDKKYLESYIENINEEKILIENDYYETPDLYLTLDETEENVVNSNKGISSRISKQEFIINGSKYVYNYTYDNTGNITCINYVDWSDLNNNRKYLYTYHFGELINETVEKHQEIIYNCTYNYDTYGNINCIERTIKTDVYENLPSTQTFIYNSYNELISYTVDGVTYQVSYNNGNPNKYKDYNLTFTNRNLTSLINTGNNISYEYNADGIRIKKVVNDTTTLYKVYNGLIIEEEVLGNEGYKIQYLYDENNLLLGFTYYETNSENEGETYYYQRTLTGEIVKIINSEGQVVGEYIYDAYGNILNISSLTAIAKINPYRYKGYYFDSETNLYYCKARYYSPEIIRWISQDEISYLDTSSVNGCNLYTYCNVSESNNVLLCSKEFNFFIKNKEIYNSHLIMLFSRRAGKTPPVKWPPLPKNLAGKKPKWNSKGYWEGKNDNFVWDPSHGGGVDRGEGKQGGHWDGEKSGDRYREDGSPLPGNKKSDLYNVSSQLFYNYDSSVYSLNDISSAVLIIGGGLCIFVLLSSPSDGNSLLFRRGY